MKKMPEKEYRVELYYLKTLKHTGKANIKARNQHEAFQKATVLAHQGQLPFGEPEVFENSAFHQGDIAEVTAPVPA